MWENAFPPSGAEGCSTALTSESACLFMATAKLSIKKSDLCCFFKLEVTLFILSQSDPRRGHRRMFAALLGSEAPLEAIRAEFPHFWWGNTVCVGIMCRGAPNPQISEYMDMGTTDVVVPSTSFPPRILKSLWITAETQFMYMQK